MRHALLALALVGCNADATPDGPPGPVTVLVTRGGVAVADAPVVFHAPAGDVVATLASDGSGRATHELEYGGMVTVVDPSARTSLVTVTHAIPSETPIEVLLDGRGGAQPAAGTLRVESPGREPTGTDHFVIETPCATFQTAALPATFELSAACFTAETVPVVVTAWTPNRSLEDPGRSLAYAAGFATGAPNASLAPAAWSQACAQIDAYVQERMGLQLWPRLGGFAFRGGTDFCPIGTPAPDFTYAYPALDFGEGVVATSFGYTVGSLQMTTLVASYDAMPATIEVGRANPLFVGQAMLVAMDGAHIEWTRGTELALADVVFAKLTWSLALTEYVTWQFLVRGGATAIELPDLPIEVASWGSLHGATERIAELRFLDASWVTHPEDIASLSVLASTTRLPASSSVRGYIQQFYPDAQ